MGAIPFKTAALVTGIPPQCRIVPPPSTVIMSDRVVKALSIELKAVGPEHPSVAITYNNMDWNEAVKCPPGHQPKCLVVPRTMVMATGVGVGLPLSQPLPQMKERVVIDGGGGIPSRLERGVAAPPRRIIAAARHLATKVCIPRPNATFALGCRSGLHVLQTPRYRQATQRRWPRKSTS